MFGRLLASALAFAITCVCGYVPVCLYVYVVCVFVCLVVLRFACLSRGLSVGAFGCVRVCTVLVT